MGGFCEKLGIPGSMKLNFLLVCRFFFSTNVPSWVKIGPVTAEILLTLSLPVGGGGWWWWVVCKVIFVQNPN